MHSSYVPHTRSHGDDMINGNERAADARLLDEHAADTRDALARMQRDPDGAWEAIVVRTQSRLRTLLCFEMPAALRASVSADDLLQETWAESLRRLDGFEYRGPGSLQRWMAGILRNKLRDAQRGSDWKRVPLHAVSLESPPRCEGLANALRRTQSTASQSARRRELEERVRLVLARLPDVERQAVLMRLYEGLTVREAGERAGVDASTISLRMKRALETCARELRGFAP
jgi:RNA polymerase sigma factor (sigma-70 family)